MVIKQDSTRDIFSQFQLENAVRSNAQDLEDEEQKENDAASDLVDNNIFADFKLDEYVKENAEREQNSKNHKQIGRRRTSMSSKQHSIRNNLSNSTEGNGKKSNNSNSNNENKVSKKNGDRPLYRYSLKGRLPSFKMKKSNNDDDHDHDENNIDHDYAHDHDDDDDDVAAVSADTNKHRKDTRLKKGKSSKSKRRLLSARSGSTIDLTIPEDETLDGFGDTGAAGAGAGSDLAGDNNDEYDDDYHLGRSTDYDDGLTWKSTQTSDSIFADFDLDSIVKDYEKLQRNVNFKPGAHGSDTEATGTSSTKKGLVGNGLVGEDDDEDDGDGDNFFDQIGKLGIGVRYHSAMIFWLDNFPRTHGIVARVLCPLMVLVSISIGLGIVLARIEIGGEIADNDAAMRNQYELIQYPYDETLQFLFNLPTVCFDYYVFTKDVPLSGETATNLINMTMAAVATLLEEPGNDVLLLDYFNGTIPLVQNGSTVTDGGEMLDDGNVTYEAIAAEAMGYDPVVYTGATPTSLAANLSLWVGNKFPQVPPGFSDDPQETIHEIKDYLQVCEDAGSELIKGFIEITTAKIQSTSDMTFNWMRCWNTTELGHVNPFLATRSQLDASGEQADFYAMMWMNDQKMKYKQYIDEAECQSLSCRKDAHAKSVAEATGADMCDINKGATAWFWVVFLTTVGYGNQSPVTRMGRFFVGSIGWFLIIIWAIILYVAGHVLGIIVNDFLRRCHCRNLTGDVQGVFIWGFFALGWMAFVGAFAFFWFNFAFDQAEWQIFDYWGTDETYIEVADSFWFAYISLLTVGLGDFFLEPEYMYYWDLFLWSYFFLIGFTFLSTWLGQVADLVNSLFPDCGDALKERLMNTDLVGHKEVQYKKENEIGIQKLEQLVMMMDDDDLDVVTQRVTRIRVKKYVLAHLLYQTKKELDYYKKRGERYENLSFGKVCEEENMLNECLAITVREREKLETYRDGRIDDVTFTEQPTKKKVSVSVLDDDGKLVAKSADELENKLSMKALKKKWDKKAVTKPSLHL